MKMYDVHSHLGKTSSGEENSAKMLVEELQSFGISKVGISSLSEPARGCRMILFMQQCWNSREL